MKVVYMGTPDFSVGALEAIIKSGHEVTAVVTQPDKPKGRSKELQISPVKACALKYNLPVFQPVNPCVLLPPTQRHMELGDKLGFQSGIVQYFSSDTFFQFHGRKFQ